MLGFADVEEMTGVVVLDSGPFTDASWHGEDFARGADGGGGGGGREEGGEGAALFIWHFGTGTAASEFACMILRSGLHF